MAVADAVIPTKVNVGDVWKPISAMKVNVGDVWKDMSVLKVNVGDVWKFAFGVSAIMGDVNLDTDITITDYTMMRLHHLELVTLIGEQFNRADIDRNGVVEGLDGEDPTDDMLAVRDYILA